MLTVSLLKGKSSFFYFLYVVLAHENDLFLQHALSFPPLH